MTSVVVSVSAESGLARMAGAPQRLRAALVRVVTRLGLQMQNRVQAKLSGEVLNVRTGTLRRSINRQTEDRPDGVFGSVGTNVVYARPHEFGFDGTVSVGAYLRRSKEQFALPRTKRVPKSSGDVFVRAHTRKVHLPERSFLRSTLHEFEPVIVRDIRDAAIKAI